MEEETLQSLMSVNAVRNMDDKFLKEFFANCSGAIKLRLHVSEQVFYAVLAEMHCRNIDVNVEAIKLDILSYQGNVSECDWPTRNLLLFLKKKIGENEVENFLRETTYEVLSGCVYYDKEDRLEKLISCGWRVEYLENFSSEEDFGFLYKDKVYKEYSTLLDHALHYRSDKVVKVLRKHGMPFRYKNKEELKKTLFRSTPDIIAIFEKYCGEDSLEN